MPIDIIKAFLPATLSFFIGIAITPVITHYLYKHKAWKKKSTDIATDGRPAPISRMLHNDEERKTPKMGGIVIWGSSLITIFIFWLAGAFDGTLGEKLNFLSRDQTWLPLFALMAGAVIGFFDDYLSVRNVYDHIAGGLSLSKRLVVVTLVALVGAFWFYLKLGVSGIYVPFWGEFDLGVFFIPFFILVLLGTYSGGVIDGIDGLSGGVFASIFSAYGFVAFFQDQINISAFSFMLVGSILAFLWFNIPPARFFMAETGSMALTLALGMVAFLTKQVAILPIIAFPLVATSLSSSIQLLSKKFRNGKKVFIVAPLHHYFEAIGWPACKVAMRYWVISIICAMVGVIISLVG